MRDTDLFQLALGLPLPWTVTRSEFAVEDGRLDLHVDFPRGSRFACAECGRADCAVHDTKDETWRHLDFFQHGTLLHARVPRVICPKCGVRKVATPWARTGSGFTLLFEAYVLALAKAMPIANAGSDASIDMGAAFEAGIKANFENAEITFDKFHVIKLANEAVDEVRRQGV